MSKKKKLKGKKFDSQKPMMVLLPPTALTDVAKVLTFGANKYGAHNWREGIIHSRLLSATMRHVNSYINGEDLDPESGINHLAHASCNLMMLLEYINLGLGKDDRWKNGNKKK
jgi:hypothetical protein